MKDKGLHKPLYRYSKKKKDKFAIEVIGNIYENPELLKKGE